MENENVNEVFKPLLNSIISSNEDLDSVSSSNYYWMINTRSYSVDGIEVPKGRMIRKKKGERPIINEDWRPATEDEVNTKQWYKGYYFNLKNV